MIAQSDRNLSKRPDRSLFDRAVATVPASLTARDFLSDITPIEPNSAGEDNFKSNLIVSSWTDTIDPDTPLAIPGVREDLYGPAKAVLSRQSRN